MANRQVLLRLPEDLYERLVRLSAEYHETVQSYIKRSLIRLVQGEDITPGEQTLLRETVHTCTNHMLDGVEKLVRVGMKKQEKSSEHLTEELKNIYRILRVLDERIEG